LGKRSLSSQRNKKQPGKQGSKERTGPKTGPQPLDSDLQRIIVAWPLLPKPIRLAMVELLEVLTPQEKQSRDG
jgi:hypothetical protein